MEDGTILHIKPQYDYVQREIYLHQGKYTYESHLVKWIPKNLQQGGTVVDIGSHIGYYLGPICKSIGISGKVFFVEPLPEHYEILQKNISINQFTWAIPINMAVSNQTGEVAFYPAKDSGRNSLAKNKITNNSPTTVQATTLDVLFTKHGLQKINLLQVDVEGAEVLVFQGASECLKNKKIYTIVCEWHPAQMWADFKTSPDEFLNKITDKGFTVSCLDDKTGNETYFAAANIEKYQHLVFRVQYN